MAQSANRIYEACFVEMGKTLRTAQFYPVNHPAFQRSLERSYLYLSQLLKRTGEMDLNISKTDLSVNGDTIRGNTKVLKFLAGELFRRRIKELHVEPTTELADYQALYSVLAREPKDIVEQGGPEKMLAKAGARHLWANALQFDLTQIAEEEELEEEPLPEEDFEEEFEEESNDHPQLRDQLSGLTPNQDPEAFKALLAKIVRYCRHALKENDVAASVLALNVISRVAEQAPDDSANREAAEKALAAIANPEVVESTIGRLCTAIGTSWESYARALEMIGSATIPYLLAQLAENKSRKERIRMIYTVQMFGEGAIKPVLQLLQDARWFIVRNALEILGEIAGQELAGVIVTFFDHEHPKVRRAAREAARKLGGEISMDALLGATQRGDEADQRHAISQLGFFPAHTVMPTILSRIDKGSPAVAEEALRVLSELDPPDMIPYLERTLADRGSIWKRRKKEPLRRTAAELLCLRLPETWPTLKSYADDPDPDIRKWVARAVEWMQKARRRERESPGA